MHATTPLVSRVHRRPRLASLALLAALGAAAGTATTPLAAFDELNVAQTLIYDTPHLAATATGDVIDYVYRATLGTAPAVDDRARLTITAASGEERRDVTLDFLGGERHLALPPFAGYRTNPVLIAMLEHVAQSMSAATGGGALYFRNRLRDAFAGDAVTIERGESVVGERRVASTTLAFAPFTGDPYLGARPGFGAATFRIVLSEAVPGGVVAIEARSGETDVPPDARFDYALHLDDDPENPPR